MTAPAPTTPPPSDPASRHGRFEPGSKLGTRYRIVGLLGRGGMGEVYRADDLELGQSVALKFLPERVAANPAELARFRNEVRVARQVAHPNVARTYDIGEADGHVFLSMEYIDGEDLSSVLRRMGRPSTDKALEISRQLCLGLAAAHDAGVLHRDLKPANVMIDGRGRVRITDFGLAGLVEELEGKSGFAGTPAYMAPEQLAGEAVSRRSDVYSLGLILNEVFTGKRVFETNNITELRQLHAAGSVTTPSTLAVDVDPAVERLVLACLERDPQQRPPSAYAVLGALPGADPLAAALAAGETPSPELVANAGQTGGLSPRAALIMIAAVLALFALQIGFSGAELGLLDESPQVLSVRAEEILKIAGIDEPPRYSAMGFDTSLDLLPGSDADGTSPTAAEAAATGAVFFWRRWSPHLLESTNFHDPKILVNNPPQFAPGSATVILDVKGRLLGLETIPSKTEEGERSPADAPSSVDWSPLLAAAGLDRSGLALAAPPELPPIHCDATAAWSGTLPDAPDRPVTFHAGAFQGRPVYFSVVAETGSTTGPISVSEETIPQAILWLGLFVTAIGPLAAAIVLARRNVALGRGDRRGATRVAVFLLLTSMISNVLSLRLSEGLEPAVENLTYGPLIGHALLHAVAMWFYYMALEPYVRRLWPRMLVSWARVLSGRLRDPLVGRDILIGGAIASAMIAVSSLIVTGLYLAGVITVPILPGPEKLAGAMSLKGVLSTGVGAAAGALSIVMLILVVAFFVNLLVKKIWISAVITGVVVGAFPAAGLTTLLGPVVAPIAVGMIMTMVLVGLFRFGLFPAMVAVYTFFTMLGTPVTHDLSSWYAPNMLLGLGLLLGLYGWGLYTALAGQPIFKDLLQESRSPAG